MMEHEKHKKKKIAMLGVLLLVAGIMRYLNFSWAHVLMVVGILLILKAFMMK
jgi:uncharacterized membrane protein